MAKSPKKQLVDLKEMGEAFGAMFSDVGEAINPFDGAEEVTVDQSRKIKEIKSGERARRKEIDIEEDKKENILTTQEALTKLNELKSPFAITRNIRRSSARRNRR